MTLLDRFFARAWLAFAALACGWLVWSGVARVRRVEYVSGLEGRAHVPDLPDAGSATGYAAGQRELIVPERNEQSFAWIAETQQMFAQRELRVRHEDADNAPAGREVSGAAPYRWWLGLLAAVDHALSGRPVGLGVERAALYADPLVLLVGLIVAAAFTAWRFGGLAAATLAVGLAALFPFASGFLPGMPDAQGLADLLGLASVLLVLAGARATAAVPTGPMRRLFFLGGMVTGLGMWISVPTQVPITAGLLLGALAAAAIGRRSSRNLPPALLPTPWRIWGASAGLTVLVAYLAEYFPHHMGTLRLDTVHPAYGIALVGAGELVALALGDTPAGRKTRRQGTLPRLLMAGAAVALVPMLMATAGSRGFLTPDLLWAQLTRLPGGAVDANSFAWLAHADYSGVVGATLLPLGVLVAAAGPLFRASTPGPTRAGLLLALGPALVAAGFAAQRLGGWSALDALILAVAVVLLAVPEGPAAGKPRAALAGLVAAASVWGAWQLAAPPSDPAQVVLTPRESEELVERHLAHWLAGRSGEPGQVVFAPPHATAALAFYGGLRGIGTFAPDNRAGFEATLNLAAARTMDEAESSLRAHGTRYVVIPSWDPFFAEFARRYLDPRLAERKSFLVEELRRWDLPPWLRAVPYQLPVGGGFAGQSVLVFEVVEEQSPAAAGGRLAEYLVETGNLDQAEIVAAGLHRFPGDVGALAAQAQVENARGNTTAAARTMESVYARLATGADRYLPWDRRVSLAIVLAQAGRADASRDQTRRCVDELTAARLRSLSTGSLYALLELARVFRLEIADPALRELAPGLLPGDLRSRL